MFTVNNTRPLQYLTVAVVVLVVFGRRPDGLRDRRRAPRDFADRVRGV